MSKNKSAGLRKASRLIGWGGLLIVIILAVVGYIVRVIIHDNPLGFIKIAGVVPFPDGKAPLALAAAAVAVIVIAIILRIASAISRAKSVEDTVAFLNEQEAEADEADDGAYLEETLAPAADPAIPAIAAPAEEAVSVSEAPAEPVCKAAPAAAHISSDPAKAAKKAEKKAQRAEKVSKVKASIGKKVNKVFPSEKRAEIKKKVESVKRTAKVIVPVAVACVAVAAVAKKRRAKRHEKQKAHNRKQFYQWLG